jgi:hypothetical protein
MDAGCSDDGFIDFRSGLIALGRERFEDPDTLCEDFDDEDEVHRRLPRLARKY